MSGKKVYESSEPGLDLEHQYYEPKDASGAAIDLEELEEARDISIVDHKRVLALEEMDFDSFGGHPNSGMPSAEVPKTISGPFVYYDFSAFGKDYSGMSGMMMPVKKSVYNPKHDA